MQSITQRSHSLPRDVPSIQPPEEAKVNSIKEEAKAGSGEEAKVDSTEDLEKRMNAVFKKIIDPKDRYSPLLPLYKQKYVYTKILGSGSSGTVFEAYDTVNKVFRAVKISFPDPGVVLGQKIEENAVNYIHHSFKNPIPIIQSMDGVDFDLAQLEEKTSNPSTPLIARVTVFELLKITNLNALLQKFPIGLPLNFIQQIAKNLLSSLNILSELGLIHGDLKPANIGVDNKGHLKVFDFGLACTLKPAKHNFLPPVAERPEIQTPSYRAPEVALNKGNYTEAVDMWSVGCTLFELATGTLLFPIRPDIPTGNTNQNLFLKMVSILGNKGLEDLAPHPFISEEILREFKPNRLKELLKPNQSELGDFIQSMLCWNPAKRMKIEDLLNHQFMNTVYPSEDLSLDAPSNYSRTIPREFVNAVHSEIVKTSNGKENEEGAAAGIKSTVANAQSAQLQFQKAIEMASQKKVQLVQKTQSTFDRIIRPGNKLRSGDKSEYEVISAINKGSYGTVLKVRDTAGKLFAAKLSHPNEHAYLIQKREETVASFLAKMIPKSETHIVSLIEGFTLEILPESADNPSVQSRCTIYELLSLDLFEFLRTQYPNGCPLPMIHDFAKQLLETLDGFSKQQFAHADLKLENIAFQNTPSDQNTGQIIKVLDFGFSNLAEDLNPRIQNVAYRAPEVVVGNTPYSPAIDMWSLACVLAELYTGRHLFKIESSKDEARDNGALFQKIILTLGNAGGIPEAKNPSTNQRLNSYRSLSEENKLEKTLKLYRKELKNSNDDLFISMLQRMLELDPNKRLSAENALKDPFITSASFIRSQGIDTPSLEVRSDSSQAAMPIPNLEPAKKQYERKDIASSAASPNSPISSVSSKKELTTENTTDSAAESVTASVLRTGTKRQLETAGAGVNDGNSQRSERLKV